MHSAAGRGLIYALIAAVALVAFAAGAYVRWQRTALEAPAGHAGVLALTRMKLPDLEGKSITIERWKGKVLVVNFWATWCPPCRQEIPGLVAIQSKFAANGVQVIGIAIDQAANVKDFAREIGITYPILIAGVEAMDVARALGNKSGALPFTVVLDRSGNVVKTHLGLLTEAELTAILAPLLA